MSFSPSEANELARVAAEAVESALADRGILVSASVSRVDPRDVSLSMHLGRDDQASDRERFVERAEAFGLSPQDHGRVFPWSGRWWRLVGLNPRARANPIEARALPSEVSARLPKEAVWAVIQARSSE